MSRDILRLVLYGSCVSRDTIDSFVPDAIDLVGYVARQGLASAFGPAAPTPPEVDRLSSAFQRRMLTGDAASDLVARLDQVSGRTDLVVWDLTDERLGVHELAAGGLRTDSVELRGARAAGRPADERHIAFGSPEHLDRFATALSGWRDALVERDLLDRTCLLAPDWASATAQGGEVPPSFEVSSHQANALLPAYLALVDERLGVPVIGRDHEPFADPAHRWGLAPFHYDDATYTVLADGIAAFAASRGLPTEGLSERRRLPAVNEGDGDPERDDSLPRAAISSRAPGSLSVELFGGDLVSASFQLYRGAERVHHTHQMRTRSHTVTGLAPGSYRFRVIVVGETGERRGVTSRVFKLA